LDTTDELVQRFFSEPGAESEKLEFKSKEITESTDGRRKVAKVLAAMANTNGGALIIGVRKDGPNAIVHDFGNQSEVKQHLSSTIRDLTDPPLSSFVKMQFDEISLGKRVLRVDVSPPPRLTYYHDGKEERLLCRAGDTTRDMTGREIELAVKQRIPLDNRQAHLEEYVSVKVEDHPRNVETDYQLGQHRLTTYKGSPSVIILGGDPTGLDGFDRLCFTEIRANIAVRDMANLKKMFGRFESLAEIDLVEEFFYGISVGDYQWSANGLHNLVADLKDVDALVDALERLAPTELRPTRPSVGVYAPIEYGLLWFAGEMTRKGFWNSEIGVLLADIPLNLEPTKELFRVAGGESAILRHRGPVSLVRFRGEEVSVRNPWLLNWEYHYGGAYYFAADNPFFGRQESISRQVHAQAYIPDHFVHGLCSADKVVCRIMGGANFSSANDYLLKEVTCLFIRSQPYIFICSPLCYEQRR